MTSLTLCDDNVVKSWSSATAAKTYLDLSTLLYLPQQPPSPLNMNLARNTTVLRSLSGIVRSESFRFVGVESRKAITESVAPARAGAGNSKRKSPPALYIRARRPPTQSNGKALTYMLSLLVSQATSTELGSARQVSSPSQPQRTTWTRPTREARWSMQASTPS